MIRNLIVRGRVGFAAADVKYIFTHGLTIGEGGGVVVTGPYRVVHLATYVAGQKQSGTFVAGAKEQEADG